MLCYLVLAFLIWHTDAQYEEFKIVGGVPIDIQQTPYQLSVEKITADSQLFHMCAAIIISETWALSAAHCNLEADDSYTLRAGSSFVDQGGSVHKIVQVVYSPDWVPKTYDSDFTLLKVDPPFEYDETTRSVKLPAVGDDGFKVGDLALVSGWGYTDPSVEVPSQRLQSATVPVVSQEECSNYMGAQVTANMFCAGFSDGGPDACKGDSGGPLVHADVLIGVVSWGKGCAQKGKIGVYAKIATKRAWITQVAGV